jgi:hypothetical protein
MASSTAPKRLRVAVLLWVSFEPIAGKQWVEQPIFRVWHTQVPREARAGAALLPRPGAAGQTLFAQSGPQGARVGRVPAHPIQLRSTRSEPASPDMTLVL